MIDGTMMLAGAHTELAVLHIRPTGGGENHTSRGQQVCVTIALSERRSSWHMGPWSSTPHEEFDIDVSGGKVVSVRQP
jgi:hypothetical protein